MALPSRHRGPFAGPIEMPGKRKPGRRRKLPGPFRAPLRTRQSPQGIHQIREIIKRVASQGTTILLASHLLDEVEKVCTHVVILRKGEKLYSGKVDGMLASHGFFELRTTQIEKLKQVLEADEIFGKIEKSDGMLTVFLNREMNAEELNKMLFDKGIILSHLVKRKESLEEQFLTLTNGETSL